MNRSACDALITSYWMLLLARYREGIPVIFEPYDGNPRQIEKMDERVMFLRETTDRAGASTCPIEEFRKDLWSLTQDPHDQSESMRDRAHRLGIKNYVEFKRDMFDHFMQFAAVTLCK